MMLDLLALLALASCAALGWFRGLTGTALWILTLVAGSLAGALLARPVGGLLSQTVGVSLLVGIPLAGFVVAGVAAGVARAASPAVRAILSDTGFRDALARGDVAGLVASGDLDALLRKLTAELERGR